MGGRARLHDLTPIGTVIDEQQYLLFAQRRLLASAAPVNAAMVHAAARRLDELVLAPLRIPAGPVVIVPTGGLHALSWSSLPSLAGRPVIVAPSAELWHRRGRPGRGGRTVLIAGPDLPGADAEVGELAGRYPRARVLRGAEATVPAALEAMARSDLVHLAAHGSFRADSPLFSSLRLADGVLTIYELERLRSTPTTVVLPACDAGRVDVRAGDELLGTAAAMVGLGVRSVVAPVMPVPDGATVPFMMALHDRLRRGLAPSVALAEAAVAQGEDLYGRAVAEAFVCIGADER